MANEKEAIAVQVAETNLKTKQGLFNKREEQVTNGEAKIVELRKLLAEVEKDYKNSSDDQEIWDEAERIRSELRSVEHELGPNRRRAELAKQAVDEAERALKSEEVQYALARASGTRFLEQSRDNLGRIAELTNELWNEIEEIERRQRVAQSAWDEVKRLAPERMRTPVGGPRLPHLANCIMPRALRHIICRSTMHQLADVGRTKFHIGAYLDPNVVKNLGAVGAVPTTAPDNAEELQGIAPKIDQMLANAFSDSTDFSERLRKLGDGEQ